jgi:hypothetical protein
MSLTLSLIRVGLIYLLVPYGRQSLVVPELDSVVSVAASCVRDRV